MLSMMSVEKMGHLFKSTGDLMMWYVLNVMRIR